MSYFLKDPVTVSESEIDFSQLPTGNFSAFSSGFSEALLTNPLSTIYDLTEKSIDDSPLLKFEDAENISRQKGFSLRIPKEGIRKKSLDSMIERQQNLQRYAATQENAGLFGKVFGFGGALAGSLLDPVNLALSFTPVPYVSTSLRTAMGASRSVAGRVGLGVGMGAAEGAFGNLIIEPFNYLARQELGDDYTAFDSFVSVAFGGILGGMVQGGGQGIREAVFSYANRYGNALPASFVGMDLTPMEVTERFSKQYQNDMDGAVNRYLELFGKRIDTDLARELSPDYRESLESRTRYSSAVHETSSEISRGALKRLLNDPVLEGDIPDVLITAGGSGAGKSQFIDTAKGGKSRRSEIILDTTLSNTTKAISTIEQIKKSGRNARLAYIFRDPMEAYLNGVLPRAKAGGRIVTIDAHMETHQKSLETFKEIYIKYKDDPKVWLEFHELDELGDIDYNKIKNDIQVELDRRYRNGEISRQIYNSATGRDESGGNRGSLGESERSGTGSDAKAEPQNQGETDGILTTPVRPGDGREEPSGQIEKLSPQARDASLQIAAQQIAEGKAVAIDAIAEYDAGKITVEELAQKLARNQNLLDELEKNRLQLESLNAEPKAETQIEIESDITAREEELNAVLKNLEQSEAAAKFEATTSEMARREITDAFGHDGKRLLESGQIRLVETEADLPGSHPEGTIGVVDKSGTAYLVLENMQPGTAKPLVLHELGAHIGIKNMLGEKNWSRVLEQVRQRMDDPDFAQARARVPKDTPANLIPEETLGYYLEMSIERRGLAGFVDKMIASVRTWAFKTLGLDLNLKEGDFRYLAHSGIKRLARNDMPISAEENISRYSRMTREEIKARKNREDIEAAQERKRTPAVFKELNIEQELSQFEKILTEGQFRNQAALAAGANIDKPINEILAKMKLVSKENLTDADLNGILDEVMQEIRIIKQYSTRMRGLPESDLAKQAAQRVAQSYTEKALLAKRESVINLTRRAQALERVLKSNDLVDGVWGILTGSYQDNFAGRLSTQSMQAAKSGRFMAGLRADLQNDGLLDSAIKGNLDRDVAKALDELSRDPNVVLPQIPDDAMRLAKIYRKWQNISRLESNRSGSWIKELKGYIARQSHDMLRIRNVSSDDWVNWMIPRLDIERTFNLPPGTENPDFVIRKALVEVYTQLANGQHIPLIDLSQDPGLSRGVNLGRKASSHRELHFKDSDAWLEYNQKFGQDKLFNTIVKDLDRSGRRIGLMDVLGTNPEANFDLIMRAVRRFSLGTDFSRRLQNNLKRFDDTLMILDGRANIPANGTLAKAGAYLRTHANMTMLGRVLISSMTDLPVFASELQHQGVGILESYAKMAGMVGRKILGEPLRGSAKQKQILSSMGVFLDSSRAEMMGYNTDVLGGKVQKAQDIFFSLTGLTLWTDSLRTSASLSFSNLLAENASRSWDNLNKSYRRVLKDYGIDNSQWDLIRKAGIEVDEAGTRYLTPEGIRSISDAEISAYMQKKGEERITAETIAATRDKMADNITAYILDRMSYAVFTPDARSRSFLLRGSRPGTVEGELLRSMAQFKSFAVGLFGQAYRRTWHGNGLGDIAAMMAGMTVLGYFASSIKDLMAGLKPRDPLTVEAWAASMLQGGALGIMGDFVMGKESRAGTSFLETLAGPVLSNTVAGTYNLYSQAVQGQDLAASSVNFGISNTPFLNLHFTRAALNYLVLYRLQESLNPGFIARMEKRVEQDRKREFLIRPSESPRIFQ